ncbi:hypothetical protein [Duffyella gerundensis]|uniref:hypothetical protein n=1 Tax=Duffyella TaxID=3026546 RepID=UPI003F6E2C5C
MKTKEKFRSEKHKQQLSFRRERVIQRTGSLRFPGVQELQIVTRKGALNRPAALLAPIITRVIIFTFRRLMLALMGLAGVVSYRCTVGKTSTINPKKWL